MQVTQAVSSAAEQPHGHAAAYSTRQVAEAVGLAPERIRGFVRGQVLSPSRGGGGQYRFTFQDIVLMRTAKGLLDADVPSRRAVSALRKLGDRLATNASRRPLSALRVSADGGAVVVRDKDALWNAETGQGHLGFAFERLGEVRAFAKRIGGAEERSPAAGAPSASAPSMRGASSSRPSAENAREIGAAAKEMDSDDWYNLGLDLEEARPEEAPQAYKRALDLDSQNADAHLNLGRLYQVEGDFKSAAHHYQLALGIVPDHQLANYNLGTVFDELGEIDTALAYYRQAPDVPDAHHNQSRIYELRGDELASLRHMRKYQTLSDGLRKDRG